MQSMPEQSYMANKPSVHITDFFLLYISIFTFFHFYVLLENDGDSFS